MDWLEGLIQLLDTFIWFVPRPPVKTSWRPKRVLLPQVMYAFIVYRVQKLRPQATSLATLLDSSGTLYTASSMSNLLAVKNPLIEVTLWHFVEYALTHKTCLFSSTTTLRTSSAISSVEKIWNLWLHSFHIDNLNLWLVWRNLCSYCVLMRSTYLKLRV